MATEARVNPGASEVTAGVHEDDLPILQSLAQLQGLQNQLNSLRTLLPRRLLGPITTALHPNGSTKFGVIGSIDGGPKSHDLLRSPDALFTELSHIAKEGVQEVEEFKKAWQTEQMEKLWERTKDMEAFGGGQGHDVWMADYAQMVGKPAAEQSRPEEKKQEIDVTKEIDDEGQDEDIKKVVEEATKQHQSLKADVEGDGTDCKVNIRVGGMRFQALQQEDNWLVQEGKNELSGDLQKAIIKQVNGRKRKASLRYLVEMLASYADVKTTPCNKCTKLIDAKFRFPYVRKDEEIKSENTEEKKQLKWLAYHEDCV